MSQTDPPSKPSPIGHALRSEIKRRALTAYQIAKEAGVSVDAIQRFLNNERGLNLATVDAVADYLGMTLVLAEGGQVIEPRADIRPMILEWRAQGMTLKAIADRLNADGIPTPRGSTWSKSQVQRVIQARS